MKTRHTVPVAALAAALVVQPAGAAAQDSESVATLESELSAMRAQMDAMAGRIDTLEAELQAARTADPATRAVPADTAPDPRVDGDPQGEEPGIAFGGAPEIEADGGWSFKPRGRLQFDAGFVDAPDSTGTDDGFGSEVRRARLGVSGDMPGGFGYKFEVDFAGNEVSVNDALIAYDAGAAEITAGQFNNFQSLEELTSSLHTSFIERAAFTDAFGFERRVGAGVEIAGEDLLLQGGLFTDNMDDIPGKNWSADARAVFMPTLGDTRLHLGGSIHYADLESGGAVRYRQRPLVHFTSQRFIDTGAFGAASELGLGVEGAVIAGPFHAVAEGFWQTVNLPGAAADPTFFGGYAEVGYFFTRGDTRGYKGGKFDRTKPVNPVGEGGAGSLQANLRYDRLDLGEAGILGGTQDGYFLSLVWKPTDYTMLLANYGKLSYDQAILPAAGGDTSYDVDVVGVRAQIDF
jgi:phosphate-selective porin OprO/OprP